MVGPKGSPDDWEMLSYYERFDEESRLTRGTGLLESARMQELIQRSLPPPPKQVLDPGGGPGAYSHWLARKGQVHPVDPAPKHVDQAHRASESQPMHRVATMSQGDARCLVKDDGSFDAVLLMGPLYHLTVHGDRIKALREFYKVLRTSGLLFAKAINRFASLLDGLKRGFVDDPYFISILERDLKDGHHRNPRGTPRYFTTAFSHRPQELEAEVREAGFTVKEIVAVQGPGWLAADLEESWSDTERRTRILDLVRRVEHESTLLGVSQHLLVVAYK